MDVLGAIGAINALLLALLLGKGKSKTISDKVLIAWVLNFALYFGNYFLFEREMMKLDVLWTLFWGFTMISHPIFLFVYSLSLTKKQFTFNLKVASNFFVFIPWIVSMIPYLLVPLEEKELLIYSKQTISYELFLPMMLQLCIEIFYFVRTLVVLIKHQNNIEQEFSYHAKINLNWLKLLTSLYIGILISSVLGYSLASAKILNIKVMDDILMIVRMLLFFYMFYHGFKQKLIYHTDGIIAPQKTKLAVNNKPEPNNSVLPEANEEGNKETIESLRKIMHDEKLYLEQELSLGEIANKLGVHAYLLTKLLNEQLGKNFFEFVNEYRVDEFKRLAVNPSNNHISILGLALDAGFNSKATFNRFFKNSTGLTPSEFRAGNKH